MKKETPEQRGQREAFERLLRHGQTSLTVEQRAALTDATTAGGQFLVPQSVGEDVNTLIKSYGPMLKFVRGFRTMTGETVNWSTLDGTGQDGTFINENDPTTTQDTNTNGVFGNVVIGSSQWNSGQILASKRLVQDAAFAITDLVMTETAQRAARGYTNRITNGNGSTTGVINISGTGDLVQTTPTAILWSEIIDLEGKVDSGYAERGAYCFNFKTYRALRKLQVASITQWDAAEFSVGRINNHPYFINNAMPDIGSTKKAVGFGDWSQVLFRQVGDMTVNVLTELAAGSLQNAYIANQRVESAVIQPSAIAFLHGA
jgi:HK97 family phage major capsid protein